MFEYPVAHLAEITWNNCFLCDLISLTSLCLNFDSVFFTPLQSIQVCGYMFMHSSLKDLPRAFNWHLAATFPLNSCESSKVVLSFHMTLYWRRTRVCHQEPRISSKVLHRITETHGSPIMSPCSSYHVGCVMLAYIWCNLTSMTVSLMDTQFEGCLQSKSRHKIKTRSLINPYFYSQYEKLYQIEKAYYFKNKILAHVDFDSRTHKCWNITKDWEGNWY